MMWWVQRINHLIVLTLWVWLGVVFLVPTSLWFEVHSVAVSDGGVGTYPTVIEDRTIHRPFVATWVVTARRVTSNGFSVACWGTGRNDYSSKSRPLATMPLNVYMGNNCLLPAGDYVLDTVWTIDVPFNFDREVRITSNQFHVR